MPPSTWVCPPHSPVGNVQVRDWVDVGITYLTLCEVIIGLMFDEVAPFCARDGIWVVATGARVTTACSHHVDSDIEVIYARPVQRAANCVQDWRRGPEVFYIERLCRSPS